MVVRLLKKQMSLSQVGVVRARWRLGCWGQRLMNGLERAGFVEEEVEGEKERRQFQLQVIANASRTIVYMMRTILDKTSFSCAPDCDDLR